MKRVLLKGESVFTGSLILVNREHPLRSAAWPKDLRAVGRCVKLEREAALQLRLLLEKQTKIVSVSGFRSRHEQRRLYEDSLRENGAEFTGQYVALPGCSEHECGLAIDLGENRQPLDEIRPSFPYDGACQDFRRKAPWFGFIQRYEEGKEGATGIAHEPWHFRYVGFPHSMIMREKSFALEEYLEFLRKEKNLTWDCGQQKIQVQYIPADEERETPLRLPENRPFRISGDNDQGFVLTVF